MIENKENSGDNSIKKKTKQNKLKIKNMKIF